MKVFSTAILMVFCSLLGSAFSNKCLGCSSENSTVCHEKPIDCPRNRCMTVSQTYEYGGKPFYTFLKGCANTTLCNTYGSVSEDPYFKIRIHGSCCKGKNCNTGKFYIPEEKPNGVKCPSAYCEGTTEECKKNLKMMECRGRETCCFDYRARVADPAGKESDISMKGCIDPEACKQNFISILKMKEVKRVLLKCCKEDKP